MHVGVTWTTPTLVVALQSESPECLLKYRVLGPSTEVSDMIGLGGGLIICISNKFLDDASAAGPRTTL